MLVKRTWQILIGALLVAVVHSLPGDMAVAQEADDEWQQPPLPENFRALARIMSTSAARQSQTLTIQIARWTTAEERQQLVDIVEGSQDESALPQALAKQEDAGFVRGTEVGSGWTSERIRYAWQWLIEGTGQRRIILALDRPLGVTVAFDQTGSLENAVSILVLDVEANGEGDGILVVGTGVTYDEKNQRMAMRQHIAEPVRLTNVRKTD